MFTECTVGCEEAVTELLLAVYILLLYIIQLKSKI